MRDLTLNGEFPRARCSSLELSSIGDVYTVFNRLIRPHEVVSFDRDRASSELHYAPLARMAVSSARIGTRLLVDSQPVEDTCLVFCVMDHPMSMTIDDRPVGVSPGHVAVIMPGRRFRLEVPPDIRSIMLDIDVRYLESLVEQELGEALTEPLEFDFDERGPNDGSGFAQLLELLYGQVSSGSPELSQPGYLARFEELTTSALIYTKSNNYSHRLLAGREPCLPRSVNRAVEHINAYIDTGISLKALADAAGVSQRSLTRAFHKYKGCSPMAYVRTRRLELARADLVRSRSEECSVTSIANKWGFYNPGRFARAYRRKFGENPADTLRRR